MDLVQIFSGGGVFFFLKSNKMSNVKTVLLNKSYISTNKTDDKNMKIHYMQFIFIKTLIF